MPGTKNTDTKVQCLDKKRDALLGFKHGIQVDRRGLLSTWGDNCDCCQWDGICCENNTGHVIMLRLPGFTAADRCLEGTLSVSITELKYLKYLDLSFNNFLRQTIPKFICLLSILEHLDLSNAFGGRKFHLIYGILTRLNLSVTGLRGRIPSDIRKMHRLSFLSLDENALSGRIPSEIWGLKNISYFSILGNQLEGPISNTISNLKQLTILNLSKNKHYFIVESLSSCTGKSLVSLGLSNDEVYGSIPNTISTLTSLKVMYVYDNQLNGTVSDGIGKLSKLEDLDLAYNYLNGVIYRNHLSNLLRLKLELNHSTSWTPPFQLVSLGLRSWRNNMMWRKYIITITPCIMLKIFSGEDELSCYKKTTKMGMTFLDLSNNLFSNILPHCWNFIPSLSVLKLQNNNIGCLQSLYLRNNSLHGEIPLSWMNSVSLDVLDLAYYLLSGYIPPNFGHAFKKLNILSRRNNKFSMGIPSSVCRLVCLQILDLSGNHFSGTLPNCLHNLSAMANTLNVTQACASLYDRDRSLDWFSDDIALFMWKRKEHSFSDTLGLYLKALMFTITNCTVEFPTEFQITGLVFLNLSQNNLSGAIPSGIGQLTSLKFLDLSQNRLSGEIPTSLVSIDYLEILDLSKNNLSGKIPLGTQLQLTRQNVDNIAPQNEHENDDIFLGLCIRAGLGLITWFWVVCGILVLKRSWRLALLRFYDDIIVRIHAIVVVNIPRNFRRLLS
ncbi:hypothetical protein RND81_O266200 [Saponaria officinalis]|uniref:Leucine-rich repeat-containing N-terminal plant-type domain-containing protein n=1 Tax=Saponaria officinalis TaxID=3572 RepID=A0AAW1GL96_SAPOF